MKATVDTTLEGLDFSDDGKTLYVSPKTKLADVVTHLEAKGIHPATFEQIDFQIEDRTNENVCLDDEDFKYIAFFTGLRVLNMENCKALHSIKPIRALSRLESLDIVDASNIVSIEPIADLPITVLKLSDPHDIESIRCPLIELEVYSVDDLSFLSKVGFKDTLEDLMVAGAPLVSDIRPVAGLRKLKSFYLEDNHCDLDRDMFEALKGMESLLHMEYSLAVRATRKTLEDPWVVEDYDETEVKWSRRQVP
jgi:hypothetical protein